MDCDVLCSYISGQMSVSMLPLISLNHCGAHLVNHACVNHCRCSHQAVCVSNVHFAFIGCCFAYQSIIRECLATLRRASVSETRRLLRLLSRLMRLTDSLQGVRGREGGREKRVRE